MPRRRPLAASPARSPAPRPSPSPSPAACRTRPPPTPRRSPSPSPTPTCTVSTNTAPSGPITFQVTNNGTDVNEFEILASDKLRIAGEKENIGPGTTVNYVVQLAEGNYFTACRKGMVGYPDAPRRLHRDRGQDRHDRSPSESKQVAQAVTNYIALRQGPDRPAAHRHEVVRRRLRGRRRRRRPRAVRRRPRLLRAHRADRRAVRRHRPGASTCARPTSSRARPGPAGTASRRTSGRRPATPPSDAAERASSSATSSSPTPRSSTTWCTPRTSPSPSTRSPTAPSA